VTATLRGPGGATTTFPPAERQPGSYPVPFPGVGTESTAATGAPVGQWSLDLSATDDLGRQSTITRTFVVDDTLGFLRAPKRWAVPPGGRPMAISWKLARPARVGVAILDETGRLVRGGLAPSGTLAEGDHEVEWNGLAKNGKRVSGALTVRVVAIGDVGRSELRATVSVTKAAGPRG